MWMLYADCVDCSRVVLQTSRGTWEEGPDSTLAGMFISVKSKPLNLHCRRLAGMCAGVQYHDSFYVFAFGVDPALRRQVWLRLLLVLQISAAATCRSTS
jgi:hypothetical protein